MARPRYIQNITSGYWLKPNQAERAIECCAAVWVEPGRTIRSVTLAEAIQMRNAQAALREPLAHVELLGVVYRPAAGAVEGYKRERFLAAEANTFAEQALALPS